MPLNFGIPSVDQLINPSGKSSEGDLTERFSACILGPEGVGKSILAMHAASWYWARLGERTAPPGKPEAHPAIVYISTDFRASQFETTWRAFGLHRPKDRAVTLQNHVDYEFHEDLNAKLRDGSTDPIKMVPHDEKPGSDWSKISDLLDVDDEDCKWKDGLFLIDLAEETGGDDWLFVNRLIGLLGEHNRKEAAPHLVIVDAVEGIEAMIGETDPFGVKRTRRSRVAQLLRTATRANANIILIVEEPQEGVRQPEEFIVDTVIRLRTVDTDDYTRRTIEVEKARGLAPLRGQHELVIRSGEGTSTGRGPHAEPSADATASPDGCSIGDRAANVDDPPMELPSRTEVSGTPCTSPEDESSPHDDLRLAYVLAVHSLHAQSRQLRRRSTELPRLHSRPEPPLFGLPYLDDMLTGGADEEHDDHDKGSVTVLTGDAGTFKSRLARRFLANAFSMERDDTGAAILISTYGVEREELAKKFRNHLGEHDDRVEEAERRGCIFTRRIALHYLNSGMFLRVIRAHIRAAQKRLGIATDSFCKTLDTVGPDDPEANRIFETLRRESWRIRLVIDDWNTLLASHPAMARDPLLLQYLVYLLQRSGVTAVIVATQSDRPLQINPIAFDEPSHNLRALDTPQIVTWPVHFFGERRIAVTAAPGPSILARAVTYELLPKSVYAEVVDAECLSVDRRFALYSGMEQNQPQRIPLRLRLFTGYHTPESPQEQNSQGYLQEVPRIMNELYPGTKGEEVVRFEPISSYGDLASYADWLDDSKLDHTSLLQIDEFWLLPDGEAGHRSLCDLSEEYWRAKTCILENNEPRRQYDADPYGRFQPFPPMPGKKLSEKEAWDPALEENSQSWTRGQFFLDNKRVKEDGNEASAAVDRVPYLKDFGFLLGRRDLWERAGNARLDTYDSGGKRGDCACVGDVWEQLRLGVGQTARENSNKVTWNEFLSACKAIHSSTGECGFDVDFGVGESLNVTLLEIWASAVHAIHADENSSVFSQYTNRAETAGPSLRTLLQLYAHEFLESVSLLVNSSPHLSDALKSRSRKGDPNSASCRHWYSTAVVAARQNDHLTPMRLPGHFSTRGDWFLGIARGSQSVLAGQHAIDILTSRRMNLLRLYDGLGLPARNVVHDDHQQNLRTALLSRDSDDLRKGKSRPISLEDLSKLEGSTDPKSEFFPLWRSRIQHYDRQSFYFYHWIAGVIEHHPDWILTDGQITQLRDKYNMMHDRDRGDLGSDVDNQIRVAQAHEVEVANDEADVGNSEVEEIGGKFKQFLKSRDALIAAMREKHGM